MQRRETLTVIRADCLAATTGWLPSKGSVAIRLVRLRAPVIGGWQAAGFGHAYRSEDPQIALCGVNLDGYTTGPSHSMKAHSTGARTVSPC
jgi:hypothetical protein